MKKALKNIFLRKNEKKNIREVSFKTHNQRSPLPKAMTVHSSPAANNACWCLSMAHGQS